MPLNFAITEVNKNYGIAGIALVPGLYWLFKRDRKAGVLFISATLLIVPAVVIAVKQIAWTPFAERYLYLPSAFCSVGLSAIIQTSSEKYRKLIIVLMVLTLTGFAFVTFQRNMLWNDKLAFVQDSLDKSPCFGSLYNELGGLLFQRGEISRAADAFTIADRLNKRPSMRLLIKANLMGVQYAKENYLGVREQFYQLFKEKKEAPAEFLELLYKADSKRMNMLSGQSKVVLTEDIVETLELLNEKRYDPFWLFQCGKLEQLIGDKIKAKNFFVQSYAAAPVDAHYRGAAAMYLRKLEQTR
jgi:tetratricopeptide (TPR) repeat protein